MEGREGGDWGAAWLSACRCLGELFGWFATRVCGGRRDVAHARSAGPKLLHRIPAQPTPDRWNCATLVGNLHNTTLARQSSMSRYGHMSHTDTADSAPDVLKQCSQCFICIVHGDPKMTFQCGCRRVGAPKVYKFNMLRRCPFFSQTCFDIS